MKIVIFTDVKNRCMLHGRVFVMQGGLQSKQLKPNALISMHGSAADLRLCFTHYAKNMVIKILLVSGCFSITRVPPYSYSVHSRSDNNSGFALITFRFSI